MNFGRFWPFLGPLHGRTGSASPPRHSGMLCPALCRPHDRGVRGIEGEGGGGHAGTEGDLWTRVQGPAGSKFIQIAQGARQLTIENLSLRAPPNDTGSYLHVEGQVTGLSVRNVSLAGAWRAFGIFLGKEVSGIAVEGCEVADVKWGIGCSMKCRCGTCDGGSSAGAGLGGLSGLHWAHTPPVSPLCPPPPCTSRALSKHGVGVVPLFLGIFGTTGFVVPDVTWGC